MAYIPCTGSKGFLEKVADKANLNVVLGEKGLADTGPHVLIDSETNDVGALLDGAGETPQE